MRVHTACFSFGEKPRMAGNQANASVSRGSRNHPFALLSLCLFSFAVSAYGTGKPRQLLQMATKNGQ